jgi:hypothetical protein
MESTRTWASDLFETLREQARDSISYLPDLLGALLVLVLGWILARLVRRAALGLALASDRWLKRTFPSGILSGARMSPLTGKFISELLFWSILLIAVTVASRIAGFDTISEWLGRITTNLPNILAAFVIVVIGFLISIFVREQLTSSAGPAARSRQNVLLGKLAQAAIVSVAFIVGLDQLGIDVLLLTALIVVAAAALSITFGISVALGTRSYMRNLVGMRTARASLAAGLHIRIGSVEGQILEITATQVTLETEQGKVLVPGSYFDEQVTVILTPAMQEGVKNG